MFWHISQDLYILSVMIWAVSCCIDARLRWRQRCHRFGLKRSRKSGTRCFWKGTFGLLIIGALLVGDCWWYSKLKSDWKLWPSFLNYAPISLDLHPCTVLFRLWLVKSLSTMRAVPHFTTSFYVFWDLYWAQPHISILSRMIRRVSDIFVLLCLWMSLDLFRLP